MDAQGKFEKLKKKLIEEHNIKVQAQQLQNEINTANDRARSIAVGTVFGGTVEINMRTMDGRVSWALLQPVEVIELIHQLAAQVGCHIAIQPRNDFASWRRWNNLTEDKNALNGHAPHPNQMDESVGRQLPNPEDQPGMQPAIMARSGKNETVATKKPSNRRGVKRASKTA